MQRSAVSRRLSVMNDNEWHFSEYIRKIEPEDDKGNDTLEFKMTKTFHFRADLSNGLTGYETVTTLNPG